MNYRRLVLMAAFVGLVASGVIAGEMDKIDKKLANRRSGSALEIENKGS